MANGKSLSDFTPSAIDRMLAAPIPTEWRSSFLGRPSANASTVFTGNVVSSAVAPRDNVLTIEKLHSAMKLMKQVVEPSPVIYISDAAARIVGENFPKSRHRSRRVLKKLIRRFGSQHRTKPACLRMGDTLLVHPILYDKLKRDLRQASDDAFMSAMFGLAVRP